jgi:glutathione S-transferase
MNMKLYHFPLSGHSHRAVLFASLIEADVDLVEVDLAKGRHKTPEFLELNSFGQVPVLEDGEIVVTDSNAILVYLAKKYRRTDWMPEDAAGSAAVQKWLSVAAGEIASGPARARLVTVFGAKYDPQDVIRNAHSILKLIDAELEGQDWIAGARPTIADIALYSYAAKAPEGNVDLSSYANVGNWLKRIEALPGFSGFVSTKVGLAT